jgi:hypothetical protein
MFEGKICSLRKAFTRLVVSAKSEQVLGRRVSNRREE